MVMLMASGLKTKKYSNLLSDYIFWPFVVKNFGIFMWSNWGFLSLHADWVASLERNKWPWQQLSVVSK